MNEEQFYDDEIAPLLVELAKECSERGMSFLASVQYGSNDDQRGDTVLLQPDASLPMAMVRHCMKTAPNIDSYMIGLARYCREKGIDTSSSIYMNFSKGAA